MLASAWPCISRSVIDNWLTVLWSTICCQPILSYKQSADLLRSGIFASLKLLKISWNCLGYTLQQNPFVMSVKADRPEILCILACTSIWRGRTELCSGISIQQTPLAPCLVSAQLSVPNEQRVVFLKIATSCPFNEGCLFNKGSRC